MLLVVDVTRGVQTQTAECLVIGELTCPRLLVVLNKIDMLPPAKRQAAIDKMSKRMHKTLENTRFQGCPVIAVAARPGGPEAPDSEQPQGVPELIELLKAHTYLPHRDASGPFLMAVDHCFSIRGQGTVMTGTVLQGAVSLNDTIEIPALKVTRKVKSMQMFRRAVTRVTQGDRVGVCVTQFDPRQLERGVVCAPSSLPTLHAAVVSVAKISYYRGTLATKSKFHITVGHETVMARVTFFGLPPSDSAPPANDASTPAPNPAQPAPDPTFTESSHSGPAQMPGSSPSPDDSHTSFSFQREYLYQEEYVIGRPAQGAESGSGRDPEQWALLEFEKPVTCPRRCLVIGSKLDTDIHANTCRLAFQGRVLSGFEGRGYAETDLPSLCIFKSKQREGQVERVTDDYTVIGRNLFKKETNLQLFVGLKVTLSTGEKGVIEGGFGQSGKFKIRVPEGLSAETKQLLSTSSKKKSKGGAKGEAAREGEAKTDSQPITIRLSFKRYIFDPHKKMVQS
ncbi:selenocysteine-specific elongation factor isoform X2 [Amia ocellicauda]